VSLDRLAPEPLAAILEPFGARGSAVTVAIQDPAGRTVAASGDRAGSPRRPDVRRPIQVGDEVIGFVLAGGRADRAIIEAIAGSVAASLGALAATARETDATDAAEATRLRLEAELALATRIQRSFIPLATPDIPGYAIASHYEAAYEVGGDFFDVFRIRGRSGLLAITVADVTGKGIAAALLMAFARPLLHAAIDHARAPVDALERTNRILVEERRSSLFITALCAVVDLHRGILRFANAGHEPPILVPADGGPIIWLEGSGRLVGAFARLDAAEQSVSLAPGDQIVFYTDGVTDARAATGERFGDARLLEVVEASRDLAPTAMVEAICAATHRFQGDMPMADDLTIVALSREPRRRRRSGVGAPR
jgi:sigma-B regulation protein RsbU (phosphoserine phosphatase)